MRLKANSIENMFVRWFVLNQTRKTKRRNELREGKNTHFKCIQIRRNRNQNYHLDESQSLKTKHTHTHNAHTKDSKKPNQTMICTNNIVDPPNFEISVDTVCSNYFSIQTQMIDILRRHILCVCLLLLKSRCVPQLTFHCQSELFKSIVMNCFA